MRKIPARRTGEGVHASLLPSACTVDSAATHNRVDPYWDQLWAPGSQANWTTSAAERILAASGSANANRRYMLSDDEAMRTMRANKGRAVRLGALSVIDSWRTATAEQAAAFTGSELLLDPRYSGTAAAFSTGMIDMGAFHTPLHRRPGMSRTVVFRPGNTDAFTRLLEPELTYPEWLSLTGGTPWSVGGQYDRHNLLATELGLRAAEYLPVGAVLGEKHTTVDLLTGSGLGHSIRNPDNRRADGVIVRRDGLRVAYEITATASAAFDNKVRRWAKLISEKPLETSGLVVLFIAAPHPGQGATAKDPRKEIYRRLAKVLTEFPARTRDSPAARIGVASWDEWFPAKHELSESFLTLRADFALGEGRGPEKWKPRDVFGTYGFIPWEGFDATAVIDNAPLIAASPHWLRTGEHTHLIGSPMDRAGVHVPVPPPVRPELGMPLPLGAGRGVSGPARLPDRLRVRS